MSKPTLRGVPSLRGLLAAMMLLAVAPLVLLLGWRVMSGLHEQRERTDAELGRAAEAVASSVDRELLSSIDALGVLAQSELFQQGRIAALGRLLQGRPRRDWDSIFLLDRDGSVVLDTGAPHPSAGMRASLQELRERVVRTGAAQVSGVVPGVATEHSVAVALPVLQGRSLRYVLGARMNETAWQRSASATEVPTKAIVTLLDADGRPIAQAGPSPAAADDDGSWYSSSRTVPRSGWQVRVALPAEPIDAALRETLLRSLVLEGSALALGLLLATLVAHAIVRRAADAGTAAFPHDVRNLITAIRAAADVLQAAPAGSPDALEAREVLARQAHRLSALLHDMQRGAPAPDAPEEAAAPPRPQAGKNVLVVGGKPVQASLGEALAREGAAVSTASDGFDGLSRLLDTNPAVAFVEMNLTGISALELARQARGAGYAGRLVALIAPGDPSLEAALAAAGFDARLPMPTDEFALRETLRCN